MAEWDNGTVSINDAFDQDDLYVEIPFIDAMKENGAFCDVKYMADNFRDSTFPLWHANKAGRDNLRAGIEYPDSGHYLFNQHADDIDWQIQCDFLGMMYPGLVNAAAERAFEIGHITNYGDGVKGGTDDSENTLHYDTYNSTAKEHTAYVGVLFRESTRVSRIEFTEGKHFDDGGWFKNGVKVEVLVDGVWTEAPCTVSPEYPNGDSKDTFGEGGETYVFRLGTSVSCDGVRVIGEAGGEAYFISVSEFTVK